MTPVRRLRANFGFSRGRGVTVVGSPERTAVERARELVRFARRHGYRADELARLIEDLG